jgi:transcriptional regulator with XRE-family HTH domain
MTIAQRLKTLRTMRNLTQEELAALSGIPNTYISLIETGKVIPAGEWDARLRLALNWTPEIDAQLDQMQEIKA